MVYFSIEVAGVCSTPVFRFIRCQYNNMQPVVLLVNDPLKFRLETLTAKIFAKNQSTEHSVYVTALEI